MGLNEYETLPALADWPLDELVISARNGVVVDAELAWAEIYSRFSSKMNTWALIRFGSSIDTDSVVQNAFINAFTHIYDLQDPAAFEHWLHTIVLQLGKNEFQTARHKHEQCSLNVLCENNDGEKTGFDVTDSKVCEPIESVYAIEKSTKIHEAIALLSTEQRHAILDFYFEHETIEETHLRTGKPVGTIKKQLFKGRNRLKTLLEKYYVTNVMYS